MTGLDALNQQRERARQSSSRSVPPPRHPARGKPVEVPQAPVEPVIATGGQPAPDAAESAGTTTLFSNSARRRAHQVLDLP